MTLRLNALVCRSTDSDAAARFWGTLLDREPESDGSSAVVRGDATQMALRFVAGTGSRSTPAPVHLHVVRPDVRTQQLTARLAIDAGATPTDVGQLPEEDHIVLSDPDGNEFCVLLTNGYLDGTGLLGEIACDGSHEVGLFWRDALGWPLVWDRDGETAIQSPDGGTKLAWSGEHEVTRTRDERYYLELDTDDPDLDTERLLRLGAVRLPDASDDLTWFADPDGSPFQVTAR